MVSRRRRNTSLNSGGCVDIVASCEEGAGASSAVGQASAVHGVAGAGWSVRAAAREVGVSRSAATNWTRGYKTYRNGVEVGSIPPLDRLAVRQISSRYLSQEERIEIADLRRSGLSMRAIADRLGRAPLTILRELRRNTPAGRGYQPFDAHRRATTRRARHHQRRLDTNDHLSGVFTELLGQRWSPQQISRHLRLRFPMIHRCGCVMRASIRLSTNRIAIPATVAVGAASPLTAAHRPGPSSSPPVPAASASTLSAADADHS